jgi:outer membrane protein assembly factor BamB
MILLYRRVAICLVLCLVACQGGENRFALPATGSSAAIADDAIPGDDAASWPMFAHDARRSGVQRVPTGITPQTVGRLALRWYFATTGARFIGGPVVSHGVVYLGDSSGMVRALDAQTGAVKWSYSLGGPIWMTPYLHNGIVYVGTHTPNGVLAAIDATTGALRWSADLPGSLRSAPVVIGNELYIGISDGDPPACRPGGVYMLNAATGEQGPVWLTVPGSEHDGGGVWGPLSWDGSRLLFGTGNTCSQNPTEANSIVAMTSSETELWHVQTAPAYHDLDVAGGVLVHGNRGYVIAKSGMFYAIELDSGNVLWNIRLNRRRGQGAFSTPVIADSTIIESNGFNGRRAAFAKARMSGGLVGISQSGTVKWTILTAHPITGSASAVPGLAFVALDNSLAAIDPATGAKLWQYPTQGVFAASSPAITSDGVFAADFNGYVYAFGVGASSERRAKQQRALPRAWLGMPIRDIPQPPPYCDMN